MKNPIESGGFEDSSTAAINRSATFANEGHVMKRNELA